MSNINKDTKQVCSQAVYNLLKAFNELSSLEEQEEVLDVIYDAMYRRSYKEVIRDRTILQKDREIAELQSENGNLKAKIEIIEAHNENLQNQIKIVEGKKKLRNIKRGLLIIISNLKHYLGDSWWTIFPGGMDNVEAFLKLVDNDNIMNQNTWSRYEPSGSQKEEQDIF